MNSKRGQLIGIAIVTAALCGTVIHVSRESVFVTLASTLQTTSGEHNPPWRATKCANYPEKIEWKSQGHEDIALFKKYYNGSACGGTFVEIGALDGSYLSNTWAYEYGFGWTGVLIEANPKNAENLKKNRPGVTTVWSAACGDGKSELQFAGENAVGGVLESMNEHHKKGWKIDESKAVTVPCKPLGDLLKLNPSAVKAVDIFFLDVEGGEYEVLKTMDWAIPVGVFVIELTGHDKEKDGNVRTLLREHGYVRADWNIRAACTGDCPENEVFEHPEYVKFSANLHV